MARVPQEFTDLLLQRGVVSLDQLSEAEARSKVTGKSIGDTLIEIEYATPEEVTMALAEFNHMPYVDLREHRIQDGVIELVPESVARENMVLPYSSEDGALRVLIADPFDLATVEKLRFILNRRIETALAPRLAIQEAINQYYGQVEGESADSMLQEFTDTAIDFTETADDASGGSDADADESSAPVVRLVQLMIQEAVQLRASDITSSPLKIASASAIASMVSASNATVRPSECYRR